MLLPLAAFDVFHALPDLPYAFLCSTFLLYVPPTPPLDPEFSLPVLQLCLISVFECPLFLVKEVLDVTGNPGLVVKKAENWSLSE